MQRVEVVHTYNACSRWWTLLTTVKICFFKCHTYIQTNIFMPLQLSSTMILYF